MERSQTGKRDSSRGCIEYIRDYTMRLLLWLRPPPLWGQCAVSSSLSRPSCPASASPSGSSPSSLLLSTLQIGSDPTSLSLLPCAGNALCCLGGATPSLSC